MWRVAVLLTALSGPVFAQSVDIDALWQRYVETCAPVVSDLPAALAALEPLKAGAELAKSEDGTAIRYESADEMGLVGDHIYANLHAGSASVYCTVFELHIGDVGTDALQTELPDFLEETVGHAPSGGVLTLTGHPETGIRVFAENQGWADFSVSGAFDDETIVTSAEILRQGDEFVASGVTFTLHTTVPLRSDP